MRVPAALAAALAVVLTLCGCGAAASGGAQTVTVSLPRMAPAAATIGHVAAPGRRVAAAGRASSTTTTPAEGVATTPVIAPLTAAANAHLNGVGLWIPYWTGAAGVAVAVDHAGTVKVAHPFDDEIVGTSTVVDQSGGQLDAVEAQLAAAHLDVIPTVTETARMNAFARILANPLREAALLRSLERIAEAPNSDGIDLDFENLAYGGSPRAADRVAAGYPALVGRLCAALHARGRSCEVTVIARNGTLTNGADGLNTAVYDYPALATVADRLQVMAYDLHYPGGPPGPIAGWPWERSVLAYALSQVPAAKLVLGVATYGYDWSAAGSATALTAPGATALAAAHHARILWDATDAEPYFDYDVIHTTVTHTIRYTVTRSRAHTHRVRQVLRHVVRRVTHHVVWFEDATAADDRAVLAADDHLGGIALWAAGDEDPSTWTQLAKLG